MTEQNIENIMEESQDYDIAPPPPSAPLWTPQIMALRMSEILQRVKRLESAARCPQMISIHGVQHLHPKNSVMPSRWEIRVHTLFFVTQLNWNWIIKAVPAIDYDEVDDADDADEVYNMNVDPNIVHLFVPNYFYKAKIMDELEPFLQLEYGDSVSVE
jgi:hypothetical protein